MSQRDADGMPVRLGMVGGGPGSFIGAVHYAAARLDGRFELVAGVFSRDPERSRRQGEHWRVAPERVHADMAAMLADEAGRSDGIEVIAIVTPNDSHFAIAAAALRAGLHVICDKPITATPDEARRLCDIARDSAGLVAVTYTYTGYPMLREARARVCSGAIGAVRKVVVEYAQGWLAGPADPDNVQAGWRTDPARAGVGGCIGDIGVHAFQLMEHVSGLHAVELCADLPRVVPGRALDDDCNILLRLNGGVPAVLVASQVATGERNTLRLRIYGETGALDWSHDAPDALRLLHADNSVTTLYAGSPALSERTAASTRLPAGHPEGFIEAFANLYADAADAIRGGDATRLIGVDEGLRSLRFVEAAVASHAARGWVALPEEAA